MAELVIIRVSLQIAWGLLSNKFAKSLENGSQTDEALRMLLLDKFQKLHAELNTLRRKELVAAVSFMENGYELFLKDPLEAKKEFTKARDAAQMAFGVVAETTDKLLATKILLASAMHEFDNKTDTGVSLCLKYVSRLNSLPVIVDACTAYIKKGLVGKLRSITGSASRHDILKVLSEINRNVWEYVVQNDAEFVKRKWPSIHYDDKVFNPVCDLLPLRESQEISKDTSIGRTPVFMVVSGKSLFIAYSQLGASDESNKEYLEVINLDTLEIQSLAGHSAVVLALVAAHGKVFSGSYDRSILVWDASSGSLLQKLGEHDGSVRSLVTSKTTLFSGGTDKVIKAWDIASCESAGVLLGHEHPISLLAFTHHLFSYAPGECINIWNIDTWQLISVIADPGNVSSMYCSVRSKLFVHCGMDIKIWNLGNVKEEGVLKGVGKVSVYIPGMRIITALGDRICHYDLHTFKCLYNQPVKCKKTADIFVLHFNYDLGMLFLGGKQTESREGIVLCM